MKLKDVLPLFNSCSVIITGIEAETTPLSNDQVRVKLQSHAEQEVDVCAVVSIKPVKDTKVKTIQLRFGVPVALS